MTVIREQALMLTGPQHDEIRNFGDVNMAKNTGYLVAAVYQDQQKKTVGDAIGRCFSTDNNRFITMDVWPVSMIWNRQAFFIAKDIWQPGNQAPEWDLNLPIKQIGVASIVCEKIGDKVKVNRRIGFVFQGHTQYGLTEGIEFYSIPANPHWYTHTGTLSIFINEPATKATA